MRGPAGRRCEPRQGRVLLAVGRGRVRGRRRRPGVPGLAPARPHARAIPAAGDHPRAALDGGRHLPRGAVQGVRPVRGRPPRGAVPDGRPGRRDARRPLRPRGSPGAPRALPARPPPAVPGGAAAPGRPGGAARARLRRGRSLQAQPRRLRGRGGAVRPRPDRPLPSLAARRASGPAGHHARGRRGMGVRHRRPLSARPLHRGRLPDHGLLPRRRPRRDRHRPRAADGGGVARRPGHAVAGGPVRLSGSLGRAGRRLSVI